MKWVRKRIYRMLAAVMAGIVLMQSTVFAERGQYRETPSTPRL